MSSIDLLGITVLCRTKPYRIPFDPPMTSYREARDRVVQLDQECRAALKQASVNITEYAPPTGFGLFMFLLCGSVFIAYSQRWWFAAGGPVAKVLGEGFAKFSWNVQPILITLMVVIHGAEAWFMAMGKLPRYSVNPRTSTFWKWTLTNFVEGVTAQMRLDKLAERKMEEKARQQH
jgi:hypothetical protein